MCLVCNLQGVAVGLAIDVEQHPKLSVCGNDCVCWGDRRRDGGDISNANRNPTGRDLDYDVAYFLCGMYLATDQSQHEMMVALDKAGRVDQVRASDYIQDVGDRYSRHGQTCGVRCDLEFRDTAALYHDRRHAIQPVQARL